MAVVAAKGCKCGSFSGGQRLGGVHLPAVPAGGDDGRRAQEIKRRRRYDLREQDGRAARPAAADQKLCRFCSANGTIMSGCSLQGALVSTAIMRRNVLTRIVGTQKNNLPLPKRSAAIAAPIALLLVVGLISLYDFTFADRYPNIDAASSSSSSSSSPSPATVSKCNLTRGEWVPDGEAPYYTNLTCPFIDDHQNCMKFGKPSLEYVSWRWKPDGCELPRFDAARFLEAMRGKSMAFVGDSLARNHFKSLLCLLSKVAQPVELVGAAPEIDVTGRAVRRDFRYDSHGFTASLFWSPFLVKANLANATLGLWDLHLDTADARWAAHVAEFDYVVLSDTNWFLRPSVYYEGGRAVGRNGAAPVTNATEIAVPRAVRAAFSTALGALAAAPGTFRGKAILRSVTPAHFENGEWNTGGDCVRTRPFRRDERALGAVEAEYLAVQVDAVREAEAAVRRNGGELRLLDITEAMDLRPDGHPSRYGHPPGGSVEGSFVVDCLHWCLPGPIDLWSELLFHMLVDQ
uniref:Leaf senescence protein-like n=1 Tax=Oryza sativa subsp. japonica TaxID=39947 RepID=Q6YWS2_ORYSJ|nr:leaf senescence protein-like [Oryza sativa Japonica Group]